MTPPTNTEMEAFYVIGQYINGTADMGEWHTNVVSSMVLSPGLDGHVYL